MVQGIVAGLILLLIIVVGSIAGSAGRIDRATGARTIGYGVFARGTAIFAALVVPVCVLLVFVFATAPKAKKQAGSIPYQLAGASAVMGLLLMVETFRKRIVLESTGVRVFGWFGLSKMWTWAEVKVERLSSGEYAISSQGKGRVKIHPLLMDRVDWLAEACREFLTPNRYPSEFQKPKATP